MNIKKLSIGIAVLAILAVIGFKSDVPAVNNVIGALTGPDISSTYLSVNGVRHEYRRQALNTATTTPCAIVTPAATSSLIFASLQIDTASSTATVWTAAKATTAFATTTQLDQFSVGSGAFASLRVNASTTNSELARTFDPNTYIVWGLAGIGPSYDATKLTGYCQAEFVAM